ncbi:MAG: hypothetical protein AAGB14_10025 [Verrucomicrobiota bacterium]
MSEADVPPPHPTVEGRPDLGPLEVALSLVKFGHGGIHVGPGFLQLRNPQNEAGRLVFIAEVFPVEAGLLGTCLLLGQGGPCPGKLGGGTNFRRLEICRVELDQNFVHFEEGAVLESGMNANDRACNGRRECRLMISADNALAFQDHRIVRALKNGNLRFQFLFDRLTGLRSFLRLRDHEGRNSTDGQDQDRYQNADEHGFAGRR